LRICTIFIFTLMGMALLGGCDSSAIEPTPRDIKIVLSANPGWVNSGYIFFQLVDDSVLATYWIGGLTPYYEIGDRPVFDVSMVDSFVSEYGDMVIMGFPDMGRILVNSSQRVLSQRQLNNIWELAENIDECEIYTWVGWGFDMPRVWVVIDGEMLWSRFVLDVDRQGSSRSDHNADVLRLVYYFIDLGTTLPIG